MRVPYLSLLTLLGLYLLAQAPGHGDTRPPAAPPKPAAASQAESAPSTGALVTANIAKLCAHGDPKPPRAGVTAAEKERLDTYLQREVCGGHLPIALAQAAISKDWLAAYQKYLAAP